MKKKHTPWKVLLATTLLCSSLTAFAPNVFAEQPYSPYWFPQELKQWEPGENKDDIFNKSSIPLADRFKGKPVNGTASPDRSVTHLASMQAHTIGFPSQGSDDFHAYAFGYWQYIDQYVAWGGSAKQGIIVAPSADIIDAAHKNGVPVLGTIFFPPNAYGGDIEWLREVVQEENGRFPIADKLIQAAEYYGFDGWFINQETHDGTEEDAAKVQKFMKYFQEHKPANMKLLWYDSMVKDGNVSWQDALNEKNESFLQDGSQRVSDNMFVNFNWFKKGTVASSIDKAQQLGRQPQDLLFGIDEQASGFNPNWNKLFEQSKDASVGLYRQDWTTFHNSEDSEDFYNKERMYWVGLNGTPERPVKDGKDWKGVSNYIAEKSVVNDMPFVTHFNTGHGKQFIVQGDVVSNKTWNNLSLQDIMPTWRWITKSDGDPLKAGFDFDRAYYGGSSLKLEGHLSPQNSTTAKLYAADLTVSEPTVVSATYFSNASNFDVKLGLTFKDQLNDVVLVDPEGIADSALAVQRTVTAATYRQVSDLAARHAADTLTATTPATDPEHTASVTDSVYKPGQWNTMKFSLKPFAGREISEVSLYVGSKQDIADFSVNIGELSVYNESKQAVLPGVTNLSVIDNEVKEGIYSDIRLSWDKLSGDVHHYEVYRVNQDGSKAFLGATPNSAYYVSNIRREGKESHSTLQVVAVSPQFTRGESTRINMEWPAYPKPSADFTAEHVIVEPGEAVKFIDKSSEVTEVRSWEFPGGTPSSSTDANPVVVYDKEGTYPVILTVKNSEGEDVKRQEQFIRVTRDEVALARNLALGKEVTASSFVSDGEAPKFAVDGKVTDNSKWCAVYTTKDKFPHWMTVDLGKDAKLSKFVIHHAESGGEGPSLNTRGFKIQLSNDGENWTDAVTVTDNSSAVSTHQIPLTNARYVKLITTQPSQTRADVAARIYEFEAHGVYAKTTDGDGNLGDNGSSDNGNSSNNGSSDNGDSSNSSYDSTSSTTVTPTPDTTTDKSGDKPGDNTTGDKGTNDTKQPVTFTDLNGHWAQDAIQRLAKEQVITAYPDGTFKPQRSMTRAEAAAMFARAMQLNPGQASSIQFADVDDNYWAKGFIEAAAQQGIIVGNDAKQFKPNDSITREELSVMIVRALKLTDGAQALTFTDRDAVAPWAHEAVKIAAGHNLVKGYPDGTFQPKQSVSRAEAALVMNRVMDKLQ
ncbi:S-layer homology domain-containing protein [Paenibacillus profundus]|uniref:S-layer homology domain-containing protein n=1 Tax=Paenibacillus profundus TaxID=1173085 RepID=A0ABS8YK33_9BACL|nr:S-layer homology domain-containing protein [Paenibacillus profundus]MCE5172166.1 S-layer homology domain-containing protein [Paenibacillus profundus]